MLDFVVLSESSKFLYKTNDYRFPEFKRSIVWNDPEIGIEYPIDFMWLCAARGAPDKRLADVDVFEKGAEA